MSAGRKRRNATSASPSSSRNKPKAKPGPKLQYDPAKYMDEVCEWISAGQTLREYCRQEGKPSFWTVYQWLDKPENATRFARARDVGYDVIAEEALQIADTTQVGQRTKVGKDGTEVTTEDMIAHRKLQVWTRLQLLAKWSPKKYGDIKQVEHSGTITLESLVAGDD